MISPRLLFSVIVASLGLAIRPAAAYYCLMEKELYYGGKLPDDARFFYQCARQANKPILDDTGVQLKFDVSGSDERLAENKSWSACVVYATQFNLLSSCEAGRVHNSSAVCRNLCRDYLIYTYAVLSVLFIILLLILLIVLQMIVELIMNKH
ncbi:MAG: hypothetical protein MHMPM18_000916 [Marteilia pararefringens]